MSNFYKICIDNLSFPMFLGILDEEKKKEQIVSVSLKIDYCSYNDSILCYQKIIDKIIGNYQHKEVDFVEILAEEIAKLCLDQEFVNKVLVKIEKRNIKTYTKAESVGVEILRENNR